MTNDNEPDSDVAPDTDGSVAHADSRSHAWDTLRGLLDSNLLGIGMLYLIGAWVLLQVVELMGVDRYWIDKLIVAIGFGLPAVLVIGWLFGTRKKSELILVVLAGGLVALTLKLWEIARDPDVAPTAVDADALADFRSGIALLGKPKNTRTLREALNLFEQARDKDVDFAEAYAGLCEAHVAWYEQTRSDAWIESATDACTEAEQLSPSAPEVRFALGNLYLRTGQTDKADREFNNVIAIDPAFTRAVVGLAQVHAERGSLEQADEAFSKALAQSRNWLTTTAYGRYLFRFKADFAGAEMFFREAHALYPDSKTANNNLGAALQQQDKLSEAADYYAKSLGIDRLNNATALSNLGLIQVTLGRLDEAAQTLCDAKAARPSDPQLWGNLALAVQYASAKPDCVVGVGAEHARMLYEAAIEKTRAIADFQSDANLLADLATYYAAINDAERAEDSIELSLLLNPRDATNRFFASVTYELLGQRAVSSEHLQMALDGGYSREHIEADPRLEELVETDEYQNRWLNRPTS